MRRIYCLFLVLLPFLSSGQNDAWKNFRYEVVLPIGASNFLGDLGGANQIGTHYFRDFQFAETRFALGLGMRYRMTEYFSLKGQFTYGTVAGDDALTQYAPRHNRNLSFRSRIYELAVNFEGSFMKEEGGHKYRLHNIVGEKAYEFSAYGFIGLGFFHFNPQAQLAGTWYDLQPLGTEGEGIDPNKKKYSLYQFAIPVGIGVKYTIDNHWGFGLEFGIRKTFTDYIDDVSTTYYDPNKIRAAYGNTAALLSNRTYQLGSEGFPSWTAPGQQRGQPLYTDSYMFLMFTINYKLKSGNHKYFQI